MNKYNSLLLLYLAAVASVLIGVLMKINHFGFPTPLLLVGVILTFSFIALILGDVWTRKDLSGAEKFMWSIGVFGANSIVGLIYLLIARRRAATPY
jgi:hypothetical protein